jgi:hypothetical protein
MTGVVAIDVTIGLIFVYLLYSLFATIICEIIANYLGLRARNLRESIIRLLEDELAGSDWKMLNIFYSLKMGLIHLFRKPGGGLVSKFYEQPTIKYLARDKFFSSPSYISPANFSKALIDILLENGDGDDDLVKIKNALITNQGKPVWLNGNGNERYDQTFRHIDTLVREAQGDLVKFRILVERWYDDTMERSVGWYKQKIQFVLLLIGLFIAIIFNVSTIRIVNKLSKDDRSREELVKMATAYLENHKDASQTPTHAKDEEKRIDSLFKVKKELEADIASANSIVGLGWDVPRKLKVEKSLRADVTAIPVWIKKEDTYERVHLVIPPKTDTTLVRQMIRTSDDGFLNWIYRVTGAEEKFVYAKDFDTDHIKLSKWKAFKLNFWGYLLTAFAISLGSPFWFDLLNKLVQLRGSVQQPVRTVNTTGKGPEGVDPIHRKG